MAKEEETPPEANRLEPFPHPRETAAVFGHEAAERDFVAAWQSGRLHHAWMIRGPQGVGKATLAYRIALSVLAHGDTAPETLDVPEDHPTARLVRAQSESRLFALRREWDRKAKRHFSVIRAEDARSMEGRLFRLSAADGGWRVAIIDTADELGMPEAANALLKIVEEPPPRSLLLLLTASPGSVLPTIRSRCRTLDLAPLPPEPLAQAVSQARAAAGMEADVDPAEATVLAALSGGAPGEALRLGALDGTALWTELAGLLDAAPGLPRPRLLALAKRLAGREQASRYALVLALTVLLLQRIARAGAGAETMPLPGETRLVQRLAPNLASARAWAELATEIAAQGTHARAVNLDPANTILNIWLRIDALAARLGARAS